MIVSSKDWLETRRRYTELCTRHGHDMNAMLNILDWIRDENLESEIFPHTSMFDLVISDRETVRSGENTLRIGWSPGTKMMRFTYNRLYGSVDTDEKIVPESESIEIFREYLIYKFGVHRNQKK